LKRNRRVPRVGAEYRRGKNIGGIMHENEISSKIIGASIEVHKILGPGLLESAYESCLERELQLQGINVQRQLALPLVYKDIKCELGYRLDLLVENKVIVELKAVESVTDVHIAQVLTYLKLSDKRLGLLINFNVPRVIDGVRRLVKKLEE